MALAATFWFAPWKHVLDQNIQEETRNRAMHWLRQNLEPDARVYVAEDLAFSDDQLSQLGAETIGSLLAWSGDEVLETSPRDRYFVLPTYVGARMAANERIKLRLERAEQRRQDLMKTLRPRTVLYLPGRPTGRSWLDRRRPATPPMPALTIVRAERRPI